MPVIGGPNIVTDGLELYLDVENLESYPGLGDGSTWYDLSGSNNGYLYETVFQNGALYFPGNSSSYCDCGESLEPTYLTAEIWFKQTGNGTNNRNMLITSGRYGTGDGYSYSNWMLGAANEGWTDDPFCFPASIADGNDTRYSTPNIYENDKWYCVCLTYDGSYIRVFLDAQKVLEEVRETDPPYPESQNNNIYVGAWRYSTFDRAFEGYINSVKVYNRALSDEEILQNYNEVRGRFEK